MPPGTDGSDNTISFIHFNDVYHIHDVKLLSRFAHAVKTTDSITVFSGDALGPSLESSILKGEHIIPVLNHLNIDVACYGNHDFDFGEERLRALSTKCNFPWLLSNAFKTDGSLLASAKSYVIRQYKSYKIGFIGLAGTDWPSNCQHLPEGSEIADPVHSASRLSRKLREEEKVDLIVAVTHMRLEEDIATLRACSNDIDLILGGHDHDFVVHGGNVTLVNDSAYGDIKIVKSGTDFRNFSKILLTVTKDTGRMRIETVELKYEPNLLAIRKHPEDPDMPGILSVIHDKIASVSGSRLLYADVPLDGRTSLIRNTESNLGNLVADAVRAYYGTDLAFVNSGSIRCDRVVPAGPLTVRDIIDIVPFDNPWVVKKLSGRTILCALENSVGESRHDGRFLQLAGLTILVDLRRPEGTRIITATLPSGAHVRPDEWYTVTMVSFIAEGFDGYLWFRDAETMVNVEAAMTDTSLLLQVFRDFEKDLEDDHRLRDARAAIIVGERAGLPVVAPGTHKRIMFSSVL